MRHHVIVVTAYGAQYCENAREKAALIFDFNVPCGMLSNRNGYLTFVIPPDGSKEGWEESAAGNNHRDEFVAWLRSQEFDDGSSPYAWAEIQYGDDNRDNRMLRCSGGC